MPASKSGAKVQTTLRLPRPVYEQAKEIIQNRMANAETFNDLVIAALRAYIRMAKRRQIDSAFTGMAKDAHFQREAKLLSAEFEEGDWEAFELGESVALGEGVRAISKTRLGRPLGRLSDHSMASIGTALRIVLDLP